MSADPVAESRKTESLSETSAFFFESVSFRSTFPSPAGCRPFRWPNPGVRNPCRKFPSPAGGRPFRWPIPGLRIPACSALGYARIREAKPSYSLTCLCGIHTRCGLKVTTGLTHKNAHRAYYWETLYRSRPLAKIPFYPPREQCKAFGPEG